MKIEQMAYTRPARLRLRLDPFRRAFSEGLYTGERGEPLSRNPYPEPRRGWRLTSRHFLFQFGWLHARYRRACRPLDGNLTREVEAAAEVIFGRFEPPQED